MRMVVVLPLPLGPRNPKISPLRTCRETLFTTCLSPKCLFRPCTSMAYSELRQELSLQCDLQRLAGMEHRGVVHRRLGDDHEDQLGAILIAVDDRRRVFHLVGDEGDGGGHVGRAAITMHADFLAKLQAADGGFRHEEADLDVFWRQKLDDGAAGADPFASAVKRVEDQAVARRGDLLLLQLPLRLLQGGAVSGDDFGLSFKLLLASRQLGDGQVRSGTWCTTASFEATAARAVMSSVSERPPAANCAS